MEQMAGSFGAIARVSSVNEVSTFHPCKRWDCHPEEKMEIKKGSARGNTNTTKASLMMGCRVATKHYGLQPLFWGGGLAPVEVSLGVNKQTKC